MNIDLPVLAVHERAMALFFMILPAAAWVSAFLQLGRAKDFAFSIKMLTIAAAWSGAGAREMQDLVAEPLKTRLQELEWYDPLETTALPGHVVMTFTLWDNPPPEGDQGAVPSGPQDTDQRDVRREGPVRR